MPWQDAVSTEPTPSVRDVPRKDVDELYVGSVLVATIYRNPGLPMAEIREAMRLGVAHVVQMVPPDEPR